jgi:hypothetical protein
VYTTLRKPTKAYKNDTIPKSSGLKTLVCKGNSRKLSSLGMILPMPYNAVSPASLEILLKVWDQYKAIVKMEN